MSFTEPIYLVFLVVLYALFFGARKSLKYQILILLGASYLFYAWWKPEYLILLLFTSLLDFWLGREIYKSKSVFQRKIMLGLSLSANLGILYYFKYYNFFAEAVSNLTDGKTPTKMDVILPIGLSFYTFQSISYLVDIYRKKIEPHGSVVEYLFYVAAFPHSIIGPIMRANEFLPQLKENLFSKISTQGLFYIFLGLFKKLALADFFGVSQIIIKVESGQNFWALLLRMFSFSFQVFLDFSAYSDIAIGSALLFGLKLPINFKAPFLSISPSEFWSRWHISLSQWLKDYLYVPLVSRSASFSNRAIALMTTMILAGLWHGANWTFCLWGLSHGVLLVIYHALGIRHGFKAGKALKFFMALIWFTLFSVTMVLFQAKDISAALSFFKELTKFNFSGKWPNIWYDHFAFVIAVAILSHVFVEDRVQELAARFEKLSLAGQAIVIFGFVSVTVYFSRILQTDTFFVYFQF